MEPRSNIYSRECPICGVRFVPAPYHVYHMAHDSRRRLVCSYGCACKSERLPKKDRRKRRAEA